MDSHKVSASKFTVSGVQCTKCLKHLYIVADTFCDYGVPTYENHSGYGICKSTKKYYKHNLYESNPLYVPYASCTCNNVGIIQDEDCIVHIYVEDIRTVNLNKYIINTDGSLFYWYPLTPVRKATYINADVMNQNMLGSYLSGVSTTPKQPRYLPQWLTKAIERKKEKEKLPKVLHKYTKLPYKPTKREKDLFEKGYDVELIQVLDTYKYGNEKRQKNIHKGK
jgi:hypothetical protein